MHSAEIMLALLDNFLGESCIVNAVMHSILFLLTMFSMTEKLFQLNRLVWYSAATTPRDKSLALKV